MTVKIKLVGSDWDDLYDDAVYDGAIVDAVRLHEDIYSVGRWYAYTDPGFTCVLVDDNTDTDTEDDPAVPSHYFRGGYELNDILEAWGLDKDAYKNQAVCYIMRSEFKSSEVEDIQKAVRYLNRWLQRNGGAE